jgi:tetratricopeptide (TPR) repeat protein
LCCIIQEKRRQSHIAGSIPKGELVVGFINAFLVQLLTLVLFVGSIMGCKIMDRDNALIWLEKGINSIELGHNQMAVKELSKAIDLNPKEADAYYLRGTAYESIGDVKRAIRDYTEAIVLNPRHYMAYTERGNAYESLNNYDDAIQDYNTAIEVNMNCESAYFFRGVV